jgi:hypothetical protein
MVSVHIPPTALLETEQEPSTIALKDRARAVAQDVGADATTPRAPALSCHLL